MGAVTLYTKQACVHSQRARQVLRRRGIPYDDIDITDDAGLREEMRERSAGGTTTPQVFIHGQHIGGTDELVDLDERGALEWMVSGGEAGEASPT